MGLQAGLRRAEIAGLTVGDLNVNRGFDSLRVVRKGAKKDAMAINPRTAQRLRTFLASLSQLSPLLTLQRKVTSYTSPYVGHFDAAFS